MANGKYLTKDHPARSARDYTILQYFLKGMSPREIALQDDIDISPRQIANILNDDDIQEIKAHGVRQLFALVPKSLDIVDKTLCNDDNKELQYKAAQDNLKTTGFAPSHTHSINIQQTFNDNSQVTVESNTLVTDLMDYRHRIQPQLEAQEIIDVTPGSDEEVE